LKIEEKFGRERKVKNSPRTLDIDIICYDNLILNDENLQIPHPNIQDRLFVLMPICDLNENWKHPIHSKTALEFIKSFSEEQINKLKKA
jgi:2-amino-4-hydroxy-6-hydroxymethyldihydropteridine pyrophosphokinase